MDFTYVALALSRLPVPHALEGYQAVVHHPPHLQRERERGREGERERERNSVCVCERVCV